MNEIAKFLKHPLLIKLDKELSPFFSSLPHLSEKVRETLVKILPYLVIVAAMLMFISVFQLLFFASRLNLAMISIFGMRNNMIYFYILGAFQLITAIIYFYAFKPMQKKQEIAWWALLTTTVISVFHNLIEVLSMRLNVFSALIYTSLSLYLLYEIKNYFQDKKIVKKK